MLSSDQLSQHTVLFFHQNPSCEILSRDRSLHQGVLCCFVMFTEFITFTRVRPYDSLTPSLDEWSNKLEVGTSFTNPQSCLDLKEEVAITC